MTKPNPYTDRELSEMYDNFLDEVYGPIDICGLKYNASKALEEVDPTTYRCGFNDWLDGEIRGDVILEVDGEYYNKTEYDEFLELGEE